MYWDMGALVDYPHYSEALAYDDNDLPEPIEIPETGSVRSQYEESVHRRNNSLAFPVPLFACEKCHEQIWSDQGYKMIKPTKWDETKDMFLDGYHDDCYKGHRKPERVEKRACKTALDEAK